jgi:hypothetical protein
LPAFGPEALEGPLGSLAGGLIKMALAMNEVTNRVPESLKELLGFLKSEASQIEIKLPVSFRVGV